MRAYLYNLSPTAVSRRFGEVREPEVPSGCNARHEPGASSPFIWSLYVQCQGSFCSPSYKVHIASEKPPCTLQDEVLVRRDIGGVDLTCRDNSIVRANHRHMQELFAQHTACWR